jgi:uncharacterized protein YndB with AHSA1/START domain
MSDTRTLIVERVIPHPPEKVWRALTQTALLEDWLMKNDFTPTLGAKFTFRTQPMPHWNGVVECEVLAIEPHQRLSYSWNAAGGKNCGPPSPGLSLPSRAARGCAWSSRASSRRTTTTTRVRPMAGSAI